MGARGTDIATTETPVPSRRPKLSVAAPADPGFAALRRAARAAIVIPPVLAFNTLVLHGGQNVIFAVFGCFALLVMSDFGGQRPARALAYLTATSAGALLVTLGTPASASTVLATAVMFVVGFAIAFSRVFGGYVAAAQTGMLLSFVIAVSIPAPASAIPARVGGWVMAGIISTLAGVFLWPRFERVKLHKHAAKACLAIANLVETLRTNDRELPRLLEMARQAERAAREAYTATAKRPAGPTRRDRAFVQLLTELQRVVDIIERPFQQPRVLVRPDIPEGDRLATAIVSALRASADVLTGGAPPDLRAVDEARDRHRAALDRWAAEQLRAGRPADEVLDGLDVDHTLRVVGYLTIALGSNAGIAAGRQPDEAVSLPVTAPRLEGLNGAAVRVARTIRTHFDPTSTVLQNSLRVAVGLAIAVLLARMLGLSHAFWVVLGTLQVLRSTALGTGRTTVQALIGNVIGVVIGGVFALLAGNHPLVMWAALPIAIFVAAYAATSVGFAASQAAFTINLIVIFNLISPAGWQVGLGRLAGLAAGGAPRVGPKLCCLLPEGDRLCRSDVRPGPRLRAAGRPRPCPPVSDPGRRARRRGVRCLPQRTVGHVARPSDRGLPPRRRQPRHSGRGSARFHLDAAGVPGRQLPGRGALGTRAGAHLARRLRSAGRPARPSAAEGTRRPRLNAGVAGRGARLLAPLA